MLRGSKNSYQKGLMTNTVLPSRAVGHKNVCVCAHACVRVCNNPWWIMDTGTVHGYQDDGTECSEALYKSLGFCQFANSIGGM